MAASKIEHGEIARQSLTSTFGVLQSANCPVRLAGVNAASRAADAVAEVQVMGSSFKSLAERLASAEHRRRLEYLRGEIEAERISYSEIAELQSLAQYIEPGDVLLLEWAGVPESEAQSRTDPYWQDAKSPVGGASVAPFERWAKDNLSPEVEAARAEAYRDHLGKV